MYSTYVSTFFYVATRKVRIALNPDTSEGVGFEATEQQVSFMAFTMNPQKHVHM